MSREPPKKPVLPWAEDPISSWEGYIPLNEQTIADLGQWIFNREVEREKNAIMGAALEEAKSFFDQQDR